MADNFVSDSSGNVASRTFAADEVTYPPGGTGGKLTTPVTVGEASGSIGSRVFTPWNTTNPVPVRDTFSTANTPTTVGPTTTVATLLASNANRRKLILINEGTVDCFVRWAAGATTTLYHEILRAGQRLELDGYTGQVTGITASGTATIRPTEFTT